MKIGIVGSEGVVGSAVAQGLGRLGHMIKRHDLVLGTKITDILDTDVVFICVPTPMNEDGSCDTTIVYSVVEDLWTSRYTGIVAVKSTVTPGTTRELQRKYRGMRICFVPEFLRERSAFADFTENHELLVIGTNSLYVFNSIKKVHGKYPKEIVQVSPTEAELIKYFNNVYCAMKVVFANGFYDVCQALGADYNKVKGAIVKRPVVEDSYLDCNENFRGYSGHCYSKDIPAFCHLVDQLGLLAEIFRVIRDDNLLYKLTVWDGMREYGT